MVREESEQLKQQEEDDTDPELECPSVAELECPSVAELECPSVVGFSVRVWCARIFKHGVCPIIVSMDFQLARVLILSQTEHAFPYPRVFFFFRGRQF